MGIIIKPLVTEKMTAITDKLNRFGFVVRPDANTYAIRNPLNAPHNAPAAIPAITPANAGSPAEQHSPVAIEEKIMIDATDTSMSPNIRIKIIPSTSGHTSIPD